MLTKNDWFLEKNICSNLLALLFEFIFIISYSLDMNFLVLEIKPSQHDNLIFAFWKLTIMTGNNVHFLILKKTKKFTNFWWLNLGTESDLSTVWIFYCVFSLKCWFIGQIILERARTYLQPHYGNGVFGNVYLSAGQH
jgi:hypothetical protein